MNNKNVFWIILVFTPKSKFTPRRSNPLSSLVSWGGGSQHRWRDRDGNRNVERHVGSHRHGLARLRTAPGGLCCIGKEHRCPARSTCIWSESQQFISSRCCRKNAMKKLLLLVLAVIGLGLYLMQN